MSAKVSILIPNYKTPEITKLCLRLIRKYTDSKLAKVIVIDNDSADESLEYLRSLPWITLIERPSIPGESGPAAHAHAMDQALAAADTPYVLSIHTDTFVCRPDWLTFLLKFIEENPKVAGVGSWKLEAKPWYKRAAKALEEKWQLALYKLQGKADHKISGKGKNHYYLRSHCALYRTDLIKDNQLSFYSEEHTAGQKLHYDLEALGYDMHFLSSEVLCPYVLHLNHATMILNPELGARKSTITKGMKRIKQGLKQVQANTILKQAELDA